MTASGLLSESKAEPRITPFPSQLPPLLNPIRKTIHIKSEVLKRSITNLSHCSATPCGGMSLWSWWCRIRTCWETKWKRQENRSGQKWDRKRRANPKGQPPQGRSGGGGYFQTCGQMAPGAPNLSTFFLSLIAFFILINFATFIKKQKHIYVSHI